MKSSRVILDEACIGDIPRAHHRCADMHSFALTALIGIMGVIDAFMQSRLYASAHFNLSPVTVVAIVFVLATIPQARFVDYLIAKDQKRQRAGSQ